MSFNYKNDILPLLTVPEISKCIAWMHRVNLLPSAMACQKCARQMITIARKNKNDGIAWICKHCARAMRSHRYISIRNHSFFSQSNIGLQKHVKIIHAWSRGARIADTVDSLDVSRRVLCTYFLSLRVVCVQQLLRMDTRLGDGGRIEIGETKFKQNTKKGAPDTSVTVFSIVDTTAQVGYMRVVPENNKPATLFSILQENIVPGTTIHALKSSAFAQLQNTCDMCNTNFNFVDLENEKHSNEMEYYWRNAKLPFKQMKGVASDKTISYLHEHMWRNRFGHDAFRNICLHISSQFHV